MKIMYKIPTTVLLLAYKRYAAKLEMIICHFFPEGIDSKMFDVILDQTIKEWVKEGSNDIPPAEDKPVTKGEWKWNDDNGNYYCSECGAISPREDQDGEYIDCPSYCPACGAEMEGS